MLFKEGETSLIFHLLQKCNNLEIYDLYSFLVECRHEATRMLVAFDERPRFLKESPTQGMPQLPSFSTVGVLA